MKIISGKYKNRIIPTIKNASYRPTTTKCREALFSILSSGEFFESQPIIDANVLDLFSGTGILSFEALSRGAKSSTLMDINPVYLKLAESFARKIDMQDNIFFQVIDIQLLNKSPKQYDIIFMDPPYYKDLCNKTLSNLIKHNWIADNAIIAIEMEKFAKINMEKFSSLRIVKEKIYGNNKIIVMSNS